MWFLVAIFKFHNECYGNITEQLRKSHLESGISFQSVFAPSVSRQCPVNISPAYNNPPTVQSAVHASSAYLTIINQNIHWLFFYFLPVFIRVYLRKRKTKRNADNLPFSHLIAVSSVKTYRSFPYRFPIFLHIRRLYAQTSITAHYRIL